MERKDDWKLLLDCWLQFWANEPLASAIPGFRSDNGQKILESVLGELYASINAPLVIAWDQAHNTVICIIYYLH